MPHLSDRASSSPLRQVTNYGCPTRRSPGETAAGPGAWPERPDPRAGGAPRGPLAPPGACGAARRRCASSWTAFERYWWMVTVCSLAVAPIRCWRPRSATGRGGNRHGCGCGAVRWHPCQPTQAACTRHVGAVRRPAQAAEAGAFQPGGEGRIGQASTAGAALANASTAPGQPGQDAGDAADLLDPVQYLLSSGLPLGRGFGSGPGPPLAV